jgi:hypothetical protein
MVSAVLAALGGAAFAGFKGPGATGRKLMVLALAASGAALILLGNGPWAQYAFPLLVLMAGLAGLGLAWPSERLSSNARVVGGAAVLVLAIVLPWSVLPGTQIVSGKKIAPLAHSLEPYQYMVQAAKPGDRCLSMTNYNPVLIMDSDPQLFMHLMCFQTQADLQLVIDAIARERPRFVLGFDQHLLWVSHGGFDYLVLVKTPGADGGIEVWAEHPNIGKVRADYLYRWYDRNTLGVLERRQTPQSDETVAPTRPSPH